MNISQHPRERKRRSHLQSKIREFRENIPESEHVVELIGELVEAHVLKPDLNLGPEFLFYAKSGVLHLWSERCEKSHDTYNLAGEKKI